MTSSPLRTASFITYFNSLKSTSLCITTPTINDDITFLNAPPITTSTAKSTTFPFEVIELKHFLQEILTVKVQELFDRLLSF